MTPFNALSPQKAFNITSDEDIWVFAYGSLMWNPEFKYQEMHLAHLCGYHRRFCLHCKHFRGEPKKPGLVLGLDRGGSCRGIVYKIDPDYLTEALNSLWEREMGNSDAYLPRRLPVTIPGENRKVIACVFVSNQKSGFYEQNSCQASAARIINSASGIRGSNFEYLERTVLQLRDFGIIDTALENIYTHAMENKNFSKIETAL